MDLIAFSRPSIDKQEEDAVLRVLRSRWLIEGNETAQFEQELAHYTHAPRVVAVSGATEALFLLLKAYEVGAGDEVIVPSLTFAATAEAVLHVGATIVFADVTSYPHLCLDPIDVDKRRTAKTKAIIPVHYAGNQAHTDYPKVIVIEDSAHRIEERCFHNNPMAFSFHATKNMTTGRGGAIAINDNRKASWLAKARNFGITKDSSERHREGSWKYALSFAGWSFHLTDMAASIGKVQLKKLPHFLAARKHIVMQYNSLLGLSNTGLHLYPILVQKRDDFIAWMRERHVQCSVHFQPLHRFPAFASSARLPVTESVSMHIVSLPLYPSLTESQVSYIASCVNQWQHKHGRMA